ncbi:MAG: hypothetical protein LBG67_03580 [Campylobacteraceae bacterium]|jgi:hypothetical protein|nr:hypothetical protein [Campylobacteraceae bacterium]
MTIYELLEKREFVEAVHYSLEKIIKLLLAEDVPFSILASVEHIGFEPKLPKEISDSFRAIVMFELYGYTLSSASLKATRDIETGEVSKSTLSFEAGFGEDDFASWVSIPLGAILQIKVEEATIFINTAIVDIDKSKEEIVEKKEDNSKRSMEALLNNPENRGLFEK